MQQTRRPRPGRAGWASCAALARLAADGRRRMEQTGEFDRGQWFAQLGADRGRKVLDVLDLDEDGRVGGRHPDAHRPERPLDSAGDDLLLLAFLRAVQELLAEVVVDGRVGAAARGAGKRNGLRAGAVAAYQQLRARPPGGNPRR